ncbi:Fic family protein [Sporosarcina sp. E16_3]|uniref:Fic family protein n=1 Tax=Sporosarcina sp. E16_3 TaxID=2789293 RepID=UPI001A91CB9F|nr:Fic family protein [Sporosarcina sp. E16_3]MBO0602417.1 Fic family protein [Sporosarcina sp. E16_3]
MSYEKLTKLYYKLGAVSYNNEVTKRKNSYGSYSTSLMIRGFRKGHLTNDSFELFYVNTHDLMDLNSEVLLNSSKISTLISKLPVFVVEPYFNKLIINEAQSNNEIEGIRSTKKELKEALSELGQSEPKNKRFVGLMKMYRYIEQIKSFENVQGFRTLYDSLVADEIKTEDIPDGELFRKGYVEVNDGNVTTHIGVSTEERIIEALGALLNYLQNESHPALYRYMVGHYYYEYIHPFYDGNGRTGRLIVGSYLSRYLEKYSAITFSYAVNKDKSKYYKALEEIPSPLNQGEMTFYLINMLELLSTGQKGIIEDLELNLMKHERINEYINKDIWENLKEESELLYFMISINVFVHEQEIFSVQKLMELSNRTRHIVNRVMAYLEQEGYVEMVSKKPKAYKICDDCLESILPS